MKLTSKELIKLVREEMETMKTPAPIEENLEDKLVSLADQLTDLLDQIEALVPDMFSAEREPAAPSMSDDDIIDQEKKFANEPPPMDE